MDENGLLSEIFKIRYFGTTRCMLPYNLPINFGILKATAAKATGPTYVKTLLVVDMVFVEVLMMTKEKKYSG